MTVTNVDKDAAALRLTITSEYPAPIERVWQLWAEPRLLERWWGPPEYPATFVAHDLTPGGRSSYFMTGPEGERYHGFWRVREIEGPHRLEFDEGFADETGAPDPAMPVTVMRVRIEQAEGGGTRMAIESTFSSTEAMEQLVAMGMIEGMQEAVGQTDALLAELDR